MDEPYEGATFRDQLVRLTERMHAKATREEMNAADFRILQEVGNIIDRNTNSLREYVRDRVTESSLQTESTLKDMEKHIHESIRIAIVSALAERFPPETGGRGGMHPGVVWGGGGFSIASVIALLLYMFGFKIPGAG